MPSESSRSKAAVQKTMGAMPSQWRGDRQAFTHIGHARISLADTALQLAIEAFVLKKQPHPTLSALPGLVSFICPVFPA